MAFVRHVAVVSLVTVAGALFGCTSLLGDFDVSGGDDASTAGDGGSIDGASGDVTQVDGPLPGDDASPMDGSEGGGDSNPCGANQIQCAGMCVSNTSNTHCGTCSHDCTNLPHVSGTVTCRSGGVCSFTGSACAPGFADCNNMPDDGCEADLSQPGHCGTCSNVCAADGGMPVCAGTAVDGGMQFSCASGCPVNTPTLCSGTCVDLNTNAQNCMTCGHACSSIANGQATCSTGNCGFNCNANYHACGNACADNNSVNTCGGACSPCALPGATAGCNGTSCTIASCIGTRQDCNMVAGDGCEIDTANDIANCASCGHICNLPNAAPACAGGACQVSSCNSGFANCNNNPVDGCEVNTVAGDPNNCGSCNHVCSVPNGTPGCGGSLCTVASCNLNFSNCNGTVADGCEINTSTDSGNCGGCGAVCGGGKVCVSSNCVCPSGTTFCGGSCVNTNTDGNNCGTCGQVCNGTSCSAGLCTPVVLASNPNVANPHNIATDGGYVFWTNYGNPGTIFRVTGSGGGIMSLAGGLVQPQEITAKGGIVYFTVDNANGGAKLMSMTNIGTGLGTLASAPSPGVSGGLAFDFATGTRMYWANQNGGSYTIFGYDLSTSTNNTVRGPFPNGQLAGLAADNNGFWFSEPMFNRTVSPLNSVLESGLTNPGRMIAISGEGYYVVNGTGGNGGVHKGHFDNSGVTTLAGGLSNPQHITCDGVNVYWSDATTGAISRIPVGGGSVFTLTTAPGNNALTVDGTYVYYVNTTNNQVLRVPK